MIERHGYLGVERWMKGSSVPIQIVEGHFRPFFVFVFALQFGMSYSTK